ncbi:hypothetical protein Leryth_019037 [Lithospermum erythrorhizon]|nr:hypothetical protein Leryth_019037 [Lithospermum erythrorhizon]
MAVGDLQQIKCKTKKEVSAKGVSSLNSMLWRFGNQEQEMNLVTKVPNLCMKPIKSHNFAIIHKHDRSEEKLKLSLYEHKKSKPDDPSCSRDVSHTTMKCFSSKVLELPLLEPFEQKESSESTCTDQ